MTSLSPFFQQSAHRKTFLFLALPLLTALALVMISFAFYPSPVFTWQQLQELQPQELPLYAFERGNLEFTITGENQLLFERWLGNPIQPNLIALDVYLIFFAIGMAGLLAVTSSLSRFWFYGGALLAAFFFSALRWEDLAVFNSSGRVASVIVILAMMGLLCWFQFFRSSVSFWWRLVMFLSLLATVALITAWGSTVAEPLRVLAVNTLPGAIVITLVFIIVIAHQLLSSFVSLAYASSKTQSLRQFLIISVIYLLNLWLAYLNRVGWLEWDYTIPSVVLFVVSTALTVWTIRQRMPLYESMVQSESLLVCLILALATLALSVYGYFLSSANDIALLSFNDLILYTHLGYGMMFLLYVASNFLGVFQRNLPVEKVLYKPTSMPYFTYRFAGLIATLAFVFYNTWVVHVNHFTSAFYTALGNVYEDKSDVRAATFYRRAHFYAPYNQFAATALAEHEAANLNTNKQRAYTLDAISFQPTEFTLLNADQLYLSGGQAYANIQLLRRAKAALPSSGLIKNNLGLALSRASFPDSASFYFRQAAVDTRSKHSAEVNLLALVAKSGNPIDLDSIRQATENSPDAVRSNALAIANRLGIAMDTKIELPKDSSLNLFAATLIANHLTNKTNLADTTFIHNSVAIARKRQNLPFRHIILPAAAKAYYAAGLVNRAIALLEEAVFLGTSPANDNYTLGLMAMDQDKHDVAIQYFLYALNHRSAPAALANAVCLAEEGRINEAIVAWDTISRRKDSTMHELGESMKRVLGAPPSWFRDLSDTERLYYSLYRIPLSDSAGFKQLVSQIASEDLRAKAYLNRAREYYRIDDVTMAARQFSHLQGLHLRDTELFAEIKYFEMRLLAATGRIKELWKIIDQGILLGPYHQSEKHFYEGLRDWENGDTTSARTHFDWLARNNWYFDEGVVAAASYHQANPRVSYFILAEALQVNPRSVRILKAYIPVALARGFNQYATGALETLRGLLPVASFQKYVSDHSLEVQ